MARLSSIAKMVRRKSNISPADKFLNELIRTIESSQGYRRGPDYVPAYSPSSIGGCSRSLYYHMMQAPEDSIPDDYCNVGMQESGSSRHESIQAYIIKMQEKGYDCEWIDVADYIDRYRPAGLSVVEKKGLETKCYNSLYRIRFLCDGLVRYDGELYIIEIKTEASHKFMSHSEPFPEHVDQACTYSLCLNVPRIIFIYENRDVCEKKAYLVEADEEIIDRITSKIIYIDDHLEEGIVPAAEETVSNCRYCKYRRQCRKDS